MTSERYNFTGTLAIEMYLGKHDAYSILNTSSHASTNYSLADGVDMYMCGNRVHMSTQLFRIIQMAAT